MFKKLVGRKLSGKKSVKTNGSVDLKTDIVTNQNDKSYVTKQNGKSYVPKQTQQFPHNGDPFSPKAVPRRWQIQEDSIV